MDIQNNVPVPSNQMPAPKNATNVILMILVVVLLLANGATLYYFLTKKSVSQPAPINYNNNANIVLHENINANTNENLATSTNSIEFANLKPLQVLWEMPTLVQFSSLVNNYDNLAKYAKTLNDNGITFDDFLKDSKVYKVGKIKNVIKMSNGRDAFAEYDNADLYIATTPQGGPAFRNNFYRIIKSYDQILLISAQSDSLDYDAYMQLFVNHEVNDYYLANLVTPSEIAIPNSKYTLVKDGVELKMLLSDFDKNNEAKNIFGNVYMTRNCFFVKAADGSVSIYYLKTDLLNNYDSSQGRVARVLNIKWNDGSDNTYEYGSVNGPLGCGGPGCYDFVNYITNENMLKAVGTSPDGLPIYELKDINTKASTSDNKSILQNIYDNNYYAGYDETTHKPKEKIPFSEFLQVHPLIFYKDPFGHYIKFTNSKFMPVAECGKPVIYLYPTKTTDVSVKVSPTGGFKLTEPIYGTGWFVKADPNGALYNYADKKTYPYLFWEGYGLDYQIPKQGFVVAKADVEKFLQEKLAQQGLVAKEYSEFIDFWLPRMQTDPYYFITFVPQAEFDKLAPLQVNPKPDTVIRVFMDYKGLDKPIQVEPQILTTPKRLGFTVVEWGGALHK